MKEIKVNDDVHGVVTMTVVGENHEGYITAMGVNGKPVVVYPDMIVD